MVKLRYSVQSTLHAQEQHSALPAIVYPDIAVSLFPCYTHSQHTGVAAADLSIRILVGRKAGVDSSLQIFRRQSRPQQVEGSGGVRVAGWVGAQQGAAQQCIHQPRHCLQAFSILKGRIHLQRWTVSLAQETTYKVVKLFPLYCFCLSQPVVHQQFKGGKPKWHRVGWISS